ncbi:AAA family ATPase [Clostridium sp. KNHs214]|uniref:AAA family ATPase n=1 Tax=Clostridium sp. KNHs214 TaxID=1540257 RepID=UPI000557B755|nr:AAA family ATPase [Clostridium sp. KNHs214]
MKNIVIMLVDRDEKYLMPIELKLIQELGDKLELIVISNEDYLKEYFNLPRHIDILIINEELYDPKLQKHNIANTFILTEQEELKEITCSLSVHNIYKYTSVKEIYNEVMSNSSIEPVRENHKSKVIMVYSPIGGSGKTTVSIGIAAALKHLNKRVFYLNTESIQSFDFIIGNDQYCTSGFDRYLVNKDEKILNHLDDAMGKKPFDYLLPFKQPVSSLNIGMKEFGFFIEKLKDSGKYDYIIVDTSNEFNSEKSMLMGYCHKVIILTKQSKVDAIKLNNLRVNIDCSNPNKFIFICNKYVDTKENYLIKDDYISNCNISEYIDCFREENITIDFLAKNRCFNKIIYMFN